MSSHVRATLSSATSIFLAEALVIPVGLVSAGLLSRSLGPDGYGLYALAIALMQWLEWTVNSLFFGAGVKLIALSEDSRPMENLLLRCFSLAGLTAGVLLAVGSPWIGHLMHRSDLAALLVVLGLYLVIGGPVLAHRAILMGRKDARGRASVAIARWLARLVGIVLAVWWHTGPVGAVAAFPFAAAVELLVCRWFVRPQWSGARADWHVLYAPSRHLFVYSMGARLYERIDLISLQMLLGGTQGFYAAAQNLSLMPSLLSQSLNPMMLAQLAQLRREGDIAAARRLHLTIFGALLLALFAGCLLTAWLAPLVTRVVYGPQFGPSAPLLTILIVGASANVLQTLAAAALNAAGEERWLPAFSIAQLLLTTAALFAFVPRYGDAGAAYVWSATGLAVTTVLTIVSMVRTRIPVSALTATAR